MGKSQVLGTNAQGKKAEQYRAMRRRENRRPTAGIFWLSIDGTQTLTSDVVNVAEFWDLCNMVKADAKRSKKRVIARGVFPYSDPQSVPIHVRKNWLKRSVATGSTITVILNEGNQ